MKPTLTIRQLTGAGQVEVRTACRHGAYRIGYQLGDVLSERQAAAVSISHHHIMAACGCMAALWPRYRPETASADLDGLRSRFEGVWAGIEAQHQRQGYALIDWAAAVRQVRGNEGAA